LAGRATRTEYGFYVAFIIGLGIVLGLLPTPPAVNTGLWIAMMFAQIRRLHDIGRTGWWALGINLAPVLPMVLLMSVMGLEDAALVGGAFALIPIIWLGVVKGQPEENRFGAPPPRTWKYMLTGR
jgi:uncharacterized membrane protein YhaH (DUF805 family)